MMRLVPSWLILALIVTVSFLGSAQAQPLPSAPVPIGADGSGSAGYQNQTPPPLPATGIYDSQPAPSRLGAYVPQTPSTGLGPPPGTAPMGQPPAGPPGWQPDPSMTAPPYPPPPYPPPPSPPPLIPSDQAIERERIFFLSCKERPGWFFNVETSIVGPHVMNRLYQNINLSDGETDSLHLPSADLGGTVAPRFEFGYRFGENAGAVLVSYRFLTAEGTIQYFDPTDGFPTGSLDSLLDLQTIDFDYASRDWHLGSHWDIRGRLGVRIGYAYFDSRDQEVFTPNDPTLPLLFDSIKTSNRFIGAGPHAMLEVEHHFRSPSLSIFAQVEGSLLIGQIQQEFDETLVQGPDSAFGSISPRATQAVPVLQTEVGFRWRPAWHDNWAFAIGYTYEQWWAVGSAAGSKAEIWSQGAFLRGEFMF
jgi:hypothetical protein